MAEVEFNMTLKKTGWFYVAKLAVRLRLTWVLNKIEGKPMVVLYGGGPVPIILSLKDIQ